MKKYFLLLVFLFIFGIISFQKNLNKDIQNELKIPIKEDEYMEELIPGFNINKETIIIDYTLFIDNLDSNYIKLIKKTEKKLMDNYLSLDLRLKPKFQLIINNINGENLYFISKINSNVIVNYYTFNFENYNDEKNYIFENINFKNKIVELDLKFKNNLIGRNSLLKTISKIKELGFSNIEQFSIFGEGEFLDSYEMSLNELEILHNLNLYSLYIRTNIDSLISIKYLKTFLINSTISEYFIYKKISKFNGNINIINI